MAQPGEFNKEMGHYLKQRGVYRRTNPFLAARNYFRTLFSVRKKQQEQPLEIPQEQVDAVIKQSTVTQPRPQARAAKPASQPAKQAKPQVASRKQQKVGIMKWFGRKEEDDYEVVEAGPVLDEDVKEVLKITFQWLKQMDPELIEEIKQSEDFEKYKKLLDKYGLIKK